MSPLTLSGVGWTRGARLLAIVRADSMREMCCSSDRTPRVVVAITDPIALNETATTAIAINTSISVNPALAWSKLQSVAGDNHNPPCQPVRADFTTDAEPR